MVAGKDIQKISLNPEINPVADYTRGALYWHIDGSNDDVPAKATMLTCRILAAEGTGNTMIANTYAAYNDLPDADKVLIANLRARHSLESSQRICQVSRNCSAGRPTQPNRIQSCGGTNPGISRF